MRRYYIFLALLLAGNFLQIDADSALVSFEKFTLSPDEIDKFANEALLTFNVPGASISILFQDRLVFSKGYGFRDLEKKLPVTEETLFPVASCTKAFTALLLCQLADEGKLSLDDPVQKYLPEFCLSDQERAAKLTIRDLLAHRTGFARHDPIWVFSEITRSQILDLLKHLEPASNLGEEFHYNNLMYTIAGMIAEKITGKSWEELIVCRILKPLEMNCSITSLSELENKNFSLPYAEINGVNTNIPFRNTLAVNAGGGLISNVLDMSHWVKLQLQGSYANQMLVQQKTLNETHLINIPFPKQTDEPVVHQGYGLGWFIGKYREHDFISHGGDIDGFVSEVALLPGMKMGIVILTNSSTDGKFALTTIRNQIIDKLMGLQDIDWMSQMQQIRMQIKSALNGALSHFSEKKNSPITLEMYTGSYFHPSYGQIVFTLENNQLIASYGKVTTPLFYNEEEQFSGKCLDLLNFGVNPIVTFKFFKNHSEKIYKVEIPFEEFRKAPPVTFKRVENCK